jgi:uncharacterized protein (TIGR03066 family)
MTLKFTLAGAVLLGLVVFSSAGTETAKKLVGVWEFTKEDGKPAKGKVLLEFKADGKYTLDVTREKEKTMKLEGKYALKGDSITITLKFGEKEISMPLNIKKLTATELHLQNEVDGKEFSGVWERKKVKK